MSNIRRAFAPVVSIAALASAVGVVLANGGDQPAPTRPAAVVSSVAPPPATSPAVPSPYFDPGAFLTLLTRVDRSTATGLIDALSPADRAGLTAYVQTRTGLAAG